MSIQAIAADSESITANRSGQMSAIQQRLLATAVKAEATSGLAIAGSFVFLFGIVLLAQSQSYSAGGRSSGQVGLGLLLVMTLAIFGWLFWRRWQKLAEVKAGGLARAEGHVDWLLGDYRAQVPGRVLNLRTFSLPAGRYVFSFLPHSGRVISAELVAADAPAQAQDELRHALAQANHFHVDDLPALRQGSLGQSGGRRLRQLWTTTAWLVGIALALGVLFIWLVAADIAKDLAPLFFVGAVLMTIGGLFTALAAIGPTLDVLRAQVSIAEGPLETSVRRTYGRGASTFYYYKLDSQVWTVSPEAYQIGRASCRERVYGRV